MLADYQLLAREQADLRHPNACRVDDRDQAGHGRPTSVGVSAHPARAVRQLAVSRPTLRHRLRVHAHAGLAGLADDRASPARALG